MNHPLSESAKDLLVQIAGSNGGILVSRFGSYLLLAGPARHYEIEDQKLVFELVQTGLIVPLSLRLFVLSGDGIVRAAFEMANRRQSMPVGDQIIGRN